ncbi:MAG: putative DNA-binding domain-containing protein [Porticoccaceae bacterium]|nr:putative DNA-binding domain-containing protein [Porticoccaceae bacterium]
MSALLQLQHEFMDFLLGEPSDITRHIQSTPTYSATKRLNIYAYAYKARLKEALETDYEKLHSYLGDEQFNQLLELYIKKYPSKQTSLRYFGASMTHLLNDEEHYNKLPILAEIARIEYAFADSFDAKDASISTLEELTALPPDAWQTLSFSFQASLQLLPLKYNSFAVWRALSDEQTPPETKQSKENNLWLIWRDNQLISRYRALAKPEAAAISLAVDGLSFPAVCEELLNYFDEDETPVKAIGFLQTWIQEGLITTFILD